MWATADAQIDTLGNSRVYGFMGMERAGTTIATNTNCDYDSQVTIYSDKWRQGDVSITPTARCATISNESLKCYVEGPNFPVYLYTATITNNSAFTITGGTYTIVSGAGSVSFLSLEPASIPPGA